MPQIPDSDIVNALIKKWQTAVAPLRTQNHSPLEEKELDQFDAEKGKHHLHHQTALYDENANLIMDFIAASVPDIIKDLLVGKELGNNKITRKGYTGKLAISLLVRCGKHINNAYVYLDYDTCVPHVTSFTLYKKMQWLEWLLLKGKEMLNANKDANYKDLKVEIIKYIETRLGNAEKNIPGLTMRINDYAKQHGLKRHTPVELEAEFDAQQAIQEEKRHDGDKGAIMKANENPPPIIAAPLPQNGLDQAIKDEKEDAIPPALNDNLPPILIAPLQQENPKQIENDEAKDPEAHELKEQKDNAIDANPLINPNKEANGLLHQHAPLENIIHNDAEKFVEPSWLEFTLNYYNQLHTMLEPTALSIKPHLATFMAAFLLNVISTETDASDENTDALSTIQTIIFLSLTSYLIYQSYKTMLEPTLIKEQTLQIVEVKEEEEIKKENENDEQPIAVKPAPVVGEIKENNLNNPDNALINPAPDALPVPPAVELQPNGNADQPQQPLAPVENAAQNINAANLPADNANPLPVPGANPDDNNIHPLANPVVEPEQPNGKPQMNGNGHLPMDEKVADPIEIEKANFIQELKDFISLQAKNIANNKNSLLGYMLFLTPKAKKLAAEDLLFIMTGRPACLSDNTIKVCKSDPDLKKILEKYEEKFILPSQLINPDKIKSNKGRFIEELDKYINARHKKFLASHREYDTILGSDLGSITGYDAPTKTRSATKLKLLLEGVTQYGNKNIEFDAYEIGALGDGELSKIIKKHSREVSLPKLPKTNGIATNSIPSEQRPKGHH